MFASLPQELDEMVLGDQLQLGQLIFFEELEVGHPVPGLKGIRPVPGRFPCVGKPEELFAIDKLLDSEGASEVVSVMEKKFRGRFQCLHASKARESENKRACRDGNCEVVVRKGFRKMNSSFVEKDSGSDDTLSSASSVLTAKTRNWIGAEQVVDCPQVVKHQMKPNAGRSCTACASLVHSAKCFSSDDRSNPTTSKISDGLAKSSTENSKSRTSLPTETREQSLDPHANRSDRKIPWNSLPPTLSKLGKEVLRQRDAAVLAAVEALQEASAADRLVQCLSTYSELQSAQRKEHQPSVNKYFNFEDDLARTRLIIQSLTNISPLKNNDRSPRCRPTMKEASVLALDRKKNATSWIKLAVAADLTAPAGVSVEATNPSHTSSKTHGGGKPKGACMVNLKNQNDVHFRLAMEKENSQNWVKESVSSAAKLESLLHDECRRWFLGSFESYLDEVQRNTVAMEWNNQVAETMCQIKKVGEWLQGIANKDESELAAYGRIKNKIYEVLLKHVERTAMALQHMNAVIEDRQQ